MIKLIRDVVSIVFVINVCGQATLSLMTKIAEQKPNMKYVHDENKQLEMLEIDEEFYFQNEELFFEAGFEEVL